MNRRKLLFVTYGFPPLRRIACVRLWNIAKYLARSHWDVTVLTVDPRLWRDADDLDTTNTELERAGIRRLAVSHRWLWLTKDSVRRPNRGVSWFLGGVCRRAAKSVGIEPSFGWMKPAERVCSTLSTGDVDIILASGPPFTTFRLARRLARRLRCPYVLDYRDLWSRHLHEPAAGVASLEASILADSAAVTTVSPSWARVMEQQFGVGPKLHVVSNGYDPEDLSPIRPHAFGHFAIVYTGSLWPPKRAITPVMAALRRLREIGHQTPWMFHYYGHHGDHVRTEAERFGVADKVVLHGVVPRASALAAVKGAVVSIVITSVEENATLEDNGMLTGKIFEPVGLGAPVIVIAPAESDAKVVVETTGLGRCYLASDVQGMASFISDLLNGEVLEPKDTSAYAWDNLVSAMDRVLCEALKA